MYCTYSTSVLSQGHRTNQRLYMVFLAQISSSLHKTAPQAAIEAGSLSECCPMSFPRLAACQKDQAYVPSYLATW